MIEKLTLDGKWTLLILAVSVLIGMTSCGEAPKQANAPKANANTWTNTAGTPKPSCDGAMEKSIEDAFRATLEKDPKIAPQLKHINYFAKGCTLVLQGWADDQASYDAVKKYAAETLNVESVNSNNFQVGPNGVQKPDPGSGLCQPGFKACGDLCIPDTDKCNIKPS